MCWLNARTDCNLYSILCMSHTTVTDILKVVNIKIVKCSLI